jgi:hypothetical protein
VKTYTIPTENKTTHLISLNAMNITSKSTPILLQTTLQQKFPNVIDRNVDIHGEAGWNWDPCPKGNGHGNLISDISWVRPP